MIEDNIEELKQVELEDTGENEWLITEAELKAAVDDKKWKSTMT